MASESTLPWITGEERLVWWKLEEAEYHEMAPAADGLLKSTVFPGLWLNTTALLGGNMKAVLASLRNGLDSSEHHAFLSS